MKVFNNLVNYIWVGDNDIPTEFLDNYERTKKLNTTYQFKIWKETDIIDILDNNFKELFNSSSLFHKLQIGRYSVANLVGGIVCDFDIEWKVSFDTVYNIKDECDIMFTKRNSLYFFNRGQKTTLLDDYVMITKPNITGEFLQFCLDRTERKEDITEPFSVYALTEWCLTKDNVGFFEPSEIYDTDNTTIAYHYNKRTWTK